jgi:hypothetical protein
MYSVLKFFFIVARYCWRRGWGILNPNLNPMRGAPMYVKYVATILLGCFWSLAFCLYTAQFFIIGLNMLAHMAVISMVFVTWTTFKGFKRVYPTPLGTPGQYPLMRHPTAEQRCSEMSDAERIAAANLADRLLSENQRQA